MRWEQSRNCCGLETVDYPRRSTSWETWIRRGHLRRVITRSASPPPHHPAGSASAVRSAPFPLSPSAPPLRKETHYARWARLGLLRACWAGGYGRPLRFFHLSVLLDVHRSHLSNHDALCLSVVMLSSVVCAVSASAVCLCLPASLSSRLLPRSAVAARLRLPYLAAARHSSSYPVTARRCSPQLFIVSKLIVSCSGIRNKLLMAI